MGDAFKALADPTRRRILELLSNGEMTAGEIAAHFSMAKPSVSHHLNTLKAAGLVTDRMDSYQIEDFGELREIAFEIDAEAFIPAEDFFNGVENFTPVEVRSETE